MGNDPTHTTRGTSHAERLAPWRHASAWLTLALALLLALAIAVALQATLANEYLRVGFWRTPVFLLAGALDALALPVAAGGALVAAAVALAGRGRGRSARPTGARRARVAAITLGALPALAVFLRLGYVENRYGLSDYWISRRDVLGVPLPAGLFVWEVWQTNLIVLGKALAVGAAAWLVVRLVLGPGGRRGARIWRAAAHPALLVPLLAIAVAVPLVARGLRDGARANVILFSIDTLRADHLSAYGYARETSPILDALAREGVLFENCVSPAPNTPPSHMSIFTSLYPTAHGFTGDDDRLSGWRLTLTEYLREAGYRTAATTDGGYMRGWFGFGQGFERYQDRYKGIAASAELVLEWLDGGLASSPFFLFVHNYDVHSPYNPPPPYRTMYTDPAYDGGFFPGSRELEKIRMRINDDPSATHGLSPADVAHMIDRYDGGIRYTDAMIGGLLDGLEARGLLETTWIVVTSDHGEEFTEHGSVLHEKLYRTVTHVPLIVRPPGGRTSPLRVPQVVELLDLMPTILEIAGTEPRPEQPLQGASLLPFVNGTMDVDSWKNVAFSEHPWRGRRRAVTRPDVHVLTSLDRRELEAYAYPSDPLEQHDIGAVLAAGDTVMTAGIEMPVIAPVALDTLRAAMRRLVRWNEAQIAIAAARPGGTESHALNEEAVEELRALGYLQ